MTFLLENHELSFSSATLSNVLVKILSLLSLFFIIMITPFLLCVVSRVMDLLLINGPFSGIWASKFSSFTASFIVQPISSKFGDIILLILNHCGVLRIFLLWIFLTDFSIFLLTWMPLRIKLRFSQIIFILTLRYELQNFKWKYLIYRAVMQLIMNVKIHFCWNLMIVVPLVKFDSLTILLVVYFLFLVLLMYNNLKLMNNLQYHLSEITMCTFQHTQKHIQFMLRSKTLFSLQTILACQSPFGPDFNFIIFSILHSIFSRADKDLRINCIIY